MKLPLISCIVPVYNGERYLREALDSIFAQAYPNLEVIVVDDGSTDGTEKVVAAYGERIHALRQSNRGPAAARNLGLGAAKGEFVVFLDADDLWHPEKLMRQMACFRNRPELDICVAHVENFWIPELNEEAKRLQNRRIAKPVPGYVTGALLARKALFDTVGHFNTDLKHGDAQEWFIRAAEQRAVMELLPDVLLYRRLHFSNISRAVNDCFDDHLRIIKASLQRRRRRDGTVKDYDFARGPAKMPDRSSKLS